MRILIAEDDAALALAWSFALRKRGHDVETVHNGAAASEFLATEQFDAVVADVLMPSCGALTLAHQRNQCCPNTCFIAVTGLPAYMPDDEGEGGVPEADATLAKPFGLKTLINTLERAMERVERRPSAEGVSAWA